MAYGAAPSAPRAIGSPYGSSPSQEHAGGEEITTLWVGDLPSTCSDDDLLTGFLSFGAVLSATVSHKPAPSGSRSGFVRFGSRTEASVALAAAASGQCTVLGEQATCQWARKNSYGGASGTVASSGYGHSSGGHANGVSNPALESPTGAAAVLQALSTYDEKFAEQVLLSAASAASSLGGAWTVRGPAQITWPTPAPSSNLWYGSGASLQSGSGPQEYPPSWTSLVNTVPQSTWSTPAAVPTSAAPVDDELATLWVGNLPEGTSDADLGAAFGACGQVIAANVHRRPSPLGSYNGFVRFATREEADSALKICGSGQLTVQGVQCVAHWAKQNSKVDPGFANPVAASALAVLPPTRQPPPPETPPPAVLVNWAAAQQSAAASNRPSVSSGGGSVQTLFIGSLPAHVTEEDVTNAFADVGFEGSVRLNKQSSRGLSGFIKFGSPQVAQEAFQFLSLSPLTIEGSQMAFDWARSDMFS